MGSEFEEVIHSLTRPINGQYPRPWMTKLQDPLQARVFIVGKNQAKTFSELMVGSHDRFLDALFNRKGQSCRGLYDRVSGGKPSPTRRNIDGLTSRLESKGVREILETNVICYSTPMSSDFSEVRHRGGRARGTEIFQSLLEWGCPAIMIVHGKGTRKRLGRILGTELPLPPEQPSVPVFTSVSYEGKQSQAVVIPSLAPPEYSKWKSWAPRYLDSVVDEVARRLKGG